MVQLEQSSSTSTSISKRIWRMIRIVCYMLRKALSKDKLMMDLHLLFKRGKIAGKAFTNLMTFHHHHDHHHATKNGGNLYSAFSCRSMDPNLSIYHPKEVEFSCSNTPLYATKRKNRHNKDSFDYDEATIRKAFEILNSDALNVGLSSVGASPSPAQLWSFGKSPKGRQLRITDSPFPLKEEEKEGDDGKVDREADEFIKRFYEQLRLQQLLSPTPDHRYVVGRRA